MVEPSDNASKRDRSRFLSYVLIATFIVLAAVVFYSVAAYAASILVILFAGVLLGVVLSTLGKLVKKQLPINYQWSIALVFATIVIVIASVLWLFGAQLSSQFDQLYQQLPGMIDRVKEFLSQYAWGRDLVGDFNRTTSSSDAVPGDLVSQLPDMFAAVFDVLTHVVVILFIGIFIAFSPRLYENGVLALVPKRHTERAQQILEALNHAINRWLLGRVISMVLIAVLLAIGLQILGVPFAIPLGLLAGALTFVPYIGAILGVVPAVFVAFSESPTTALWVLVIYAVAQFMESFIVTPLVQKRVVAIAPAILLTSQVILGALAGAWGIAFASPLAVCGIVLVQMIYVEDVLGKDVEVIGNGES